MGECPSNMVTAASLEVTLSVGAAPVWVGSTAAAAWWMVGI